MVEQEAWRGDKKKEENRTTLFHNVWGRVRHLRRGDEFRLKSEAETLAFVLCEEIELIVNKKLELSSDKEETVQSTTGD